MALRGSAVVALALLAVACVSAPAAEPLLILTDAEIRGVLEGQALSVAQQNGGKTFARESFCATELWRAETSRLSLSGRYEINNDLLCIEHGVRLCRRVFRDRDGGLYMQAIVPDAPMTPVFVEGAARCKN